MRWKAPGKPKQNFGIVRLSPKPLFELNGRTLKSRPTLSSRSQSPPYWKNGSTGHVSSIVLRIEYQLIALGHVGYSGRWQKVEDLLVSHKAEQHPANEHNTVLTVFETFASNNRRKRAHRSSAEICHVAKINPWNDTTITFNACDEPRFQTVRAPAALVLSPIVDGFWLTKVLMDDGSGLNLIYEETLSKMEIDKSRIEQSGTTFRGIIPVGKCGVRERNKGEGNGEEGQP